MPKKQERLTSLKDLADKFKEFNNPARPTTWTKKGDFVVIIAGKDERCCYHGRAGIVLHVEGDGATIGFFDGHRSAREQELLNKPGSLVPLNIVSWLTWRHRNIHMLN